MSDGSAMEVCFAVQHFWSRETACFDFRVRTRNLTRGADAVLQVAVHEAALCNPPAVELRMPALFFVARRAEQNNHPPTPLRM